MIMGKIRAGKCRSKLSERGRAKLLLLVRYEALVVQLSFSLLLFFPSFCSHFPNSFISLFITEQDALEAADFKQYSMRTRESLSCWNPDSIGFNLIENVLCHICREQRPGAVLVFMTGWDDINSLKDQLQANPILGDPSRVLLLACHGSMASSEQVVYSLLIDCFFI